MGGGGWTAGASTGSGLAITTATGSSDVLSDGSCLRSTSPSETGLAVSLPDARLAAGPRALAPKLGAIFIRDLRIAMLMLAYDVSFTEKKERVYKFDAYVNHYVTPYS